MSAERGAGSWEWGAGPPARGAYGSERRQGTGDRGQTAGGGSQALRLVEPYGSEREPYGSGRDRGHDAYGIRPTACGGRGGFTLVEMLVVITIVAILSALVTPALQGLMGTSGRRGGLNTLTAVIEQARLAAIENGTTVHIGFPTNSTNATNRFSQMIIFRDARPNETNTNPVTLTRWQRLPNGVFFAAGNEFATTLTNRDRLRGHLPKLGGVEDLTRVPVLTFNRFGQLRGAANEVSLLLGEKVNPTDTAWRGGTNSYYEVRIQPLTGRAIVRDMSTNPVAP